MKANPNTKIIISGHADKATGNTRINRTLSEQRCAAVAKALQDAGIAASRVSTSAYGDTANPFPNRQPEDNRVAICVVSE